MSYTTDKDAEKIVESAVRYAIEEMDRKGKLWTRLAITRALESAYIRGATDATRLQIEATDKLLAANRVGEPRVEYGDGSLEWTADPRPLADVVNVLTGAGEGATPPTAQEVLRACKPSPALVSLLAAETIKACHEGRIDDALTALALGLCARSAWIEGRALV